MHELWLWPEESDRIRWWTQSDTGLLDDPKLERCGRAEVREALFEGGREKALSTLLERPVANLLTNELGDGGRLRLRLSDELSDPWHTCAYERLLLEDGEELFGRLVVERYVRVVPDRRGVGPASPRGVLFDLLPDTPSEEFVEGEREVFHAAAGSLHVMSALGTCLDSPSLIQHLLEQKDLSQSGFLCIVAHGTEQTAKHPFRQSDGTPWTLPLQSGLSPLVILLACGSFEGNLIDYGRHLLLAGARTVLAPAGQISATEAGAFLSHFIAGWERGDPVARILLAAQSADRRAIGARRLLLLGDGDLHAGDPFTHELTDKALDRAITAGDEKALTALVDRITFEVHHADGNAGRTVSELYRRLGFDYDDPNEGPEPLRKLLAVADAVWPLSQCWLHPFLGYLAQVHDYPQMQRFRGARIRAGEAGAWLPDSPIFFHYLATPDYRNGMYAAGVKKLVAGISKIKGETPCTEAGIKLLGNLINHLIDLGLPEDASLVAGELDRCLESYEGPTAETDRFTLKDRQARIALRKGRSADETDEPIVRALTLFEAKRQKLLEAGQDGLRELAWLLYAATWGCPARARTASYAAEVKAALADWQSVSADIGAGNDTRLYLLRALALWGWRGHDSEALDLVVRYLETLADRGLRQDAGPLGFAAAFLALARGEPRSEQWLQMKVLMERDRYWLELTALSYLMGDKPATERYLGRLQHQRRLAFEHLKMLPTWLAGGAFSGDQWVQRWNSLTHREHKETELFVHRAETPSPEVVVDAGLLPM
jgi:hypothetical protein